MAIIAISVALILALLLGGVWAIIHFVNINNAGNLDYLESDLRKYLVLKESDYKGYTIEIAVPPVTDDDVEAIILRRLAEKKGALLFDGHYVTSEPIAAGDIAYLRYIGYTIDENGVRHELDFEEYCNFEDADSKRFEIGRGTFPVSTVELDLVGRIPTDYGKFTKVEKGAIKSTDVAYCTVTYSTLDGEKHENEKIRFDLTDPKLNDIWGMGFSDYILERMIGITSFDSRTFYYHGSDDALIVEQFRVDYVTRIAGEPLKVEATVPYDNDDEDLRGKTVYFDIYIDQTVCYERREFNDQFVTETLGYTEEKLAEYEGQTPSEKYRNMIKHSLDVIYEENYYAAAEQAMWDYLCSTVKFKKLPENEIKRIFDNYYYEFQTLYAANASAYAGLDAFICSCYGLEEYEDWRGVLTAQVTREVQEKLIFYSILKAENLIPTDEEYPALYRKELEADYLYYSGKTREDFKTDAEFEEALAAYEKEMLDYYGEEKYRESIYYYYASEKMLEFAKVVNKAEK